MAQGPKSRQFCLSKWARNSDNSLGSGPEIEKISWFRARNSYIYLEAGPKIKTNRFRAQNSYIYVDSGPGIKTIVLDQVRNSAITLALGPKSRQCHGSGPVIQIFILAQGLKSKQLFRSRAQNSDIYLCSGPGIRTIELYQGPKFRQLLGGSGPEVRILQYNTLKQYNLFHVRKDTTVTIVIFIRTII